MNNLWTVKLGSIGLVTLMLLGLGIAGTIRNGTAARISESQAAEASTGQTGDHAGKDEMEITANETLVPEIVLTGDDREFLDQLEKLFSQGDLEGAARVLSGYRIPWKEYPCMYDGTAMTAQVSSGPGLVFTKASTVFYGDFKEGKPQGQCTAFQLLALEEGKRYDYSKGSWENGKMNGEGECGYNYFDGVTEDITKENVKKGVFQDDLMQGEIMYISTNAAGEATTWQFQVTDGIIVPDERWIKDTDSSGAVSYRLMAMEDKVHAYILSDSAMSEDRWKNLIVYEALKAGGFNG